MLCTCTYLQRVLKIRLKLVKKYFVSTNQVKKLFTVIIWCGPKFDRTINSLRSIADINVTGYFINGREYLLSSFLIKRRGLSENPVIVTWSPCKNFYNLPFLLILIELTPFFPISYRHGCYMTWSDHNVIIVKWFCIQLRIFETPSGTEYKLLLDSRRSCTGKRFFFLSAL